MGSKKSAVKEERFEYSIMILRLAIIFCLGTANLVQGAISDGPSDDEKKGFTDSMNDFTQDFLAVAWDDFGENFVFSPFSLHSVLAMLTTGSTNDSKTQKELLTAFGRNDKIASLKKFYDAKFEKLPTDEKQAVATVNNWVNETTNGKISNIIDSVSPDTAMLIVNALHFKASWAKSFEDGKPQEFTKTDGSKTIINMMRRESKKQAAGQFETELVKGRSNKCIALAIPYEGSEGLGNEGRFEMLIIMPEHHQGLRDFQFKALKDVQETGANGNLIELALKSLEVPRENRDDHIINMPEFTIDSNIGAVPMLQKLGVDAGDFKGIVEDEPLKVSKIKHRVTIEVTKEGT